MSESQTSSAHDGRLVLRNTAYLGIAEVLTTPLSVVLNAMLARFLGAANLGHIYFATTICSAAMLFVGWGQGGPLPAAVALDRASAGRFLGTSLAWRLGAALVTYALVAVSCHMLGFSAAEQWAIGLVFLASSLANLVNACQEAIRGFERTDIAAYTRVGSQLLATVLVIPVLLAGGGLRMTLAAQALGWLAVLVVIVRTLRPIGVAQLTWDRAAFGHLMRAGTPFVFFDVVLKVQPGIDAFYLARLAPSEVVGWYAVSQRLVGFLLIPATALVGALYPTLCRLYATDRAGFLRTTRESLVTVSMLVMPVALGCALYPDIGVSIFGREAFRPAEDTLRVFALDVFLIYFSMLIGTALLAAGRQRIWTFVQLVCVVNSLVLDPLLIRYFQARTGNGGTGLPVTATISELLMAAVGAALLPKGVLDGALIKRLLLSLASGAVMVGAALSLRGLSSWVAAPIAGLSYVLALYWTGAVSREQFAALQGFVGRKLRRKRAPASSPL